VTDLVVSRAERPLVGSVPVPSDKSIGHRALLLGALCHGTSRIAGYAGGEDNAATRRAFESMGVSFEIDKNEIRPRGVGLFGLRAPDRDIDCGNSGTTMRLLCGLLSAQTFASRLIGDESLSRRPMLRVVAPLRMRGARISGEPHPTKPGDLTAPLRIDALAEDEHPSALEYELPVASAQVKSALLLSGLYAHGPTTLSEPTLSRDHTERMLLSLGVPLRTMGPLVELDPAGWNGMMPAFDLTLPGDVSAAAFLIAAAVTVPGSRITVRGVGTNPTRTGILEIARDMGVELVVEPQGETGGEPFANLHVGGATRPHGVGVGGELVPRAIDEIPALCVIAARSTGVTRIVDAAELRVKESDRIAAMTDVLRAFGVPCEPAPDGLTIEGVGDRPLRAASIDSRGDHRIAMAAAVLALAAEQESRIVDADCIQTSFPRFVGTLRALGATIGVDEK
jgi:3-phosphoshikimate 1-carboxyvinyltransferase